MIDKRLQEIIEAEKRGLLAILPCLQGDTVYVINRRNKCIYEHTCTGVMLGRGSRDYIETVYRFGDNKSYFKWKMRQMGKMFFLDKEAAEFALERLEREKDVK